VNITAGTPVLVRDVGPESFAVESPVACDVGSRQEFEFSSYGLTTTVVGIVKRCDRFAGERYVIGCAALYRTATDRSVVAGCVDVLGGASAVRSQR
jgi:hypothetical protein